MNYFLLADTEFFRRINEAGDCNMETAYMAFANQVIELCGSMNTSHAIIALAYIEIELQHHPVRLLSEERKEAAAYIGKALSFVRKMQKFLTTPQVPPLSYLPSSAETPSDNPAPPLQWTGNAIDLVELIYGIYEMGCINNGEIQTACPAAVPDFRCRSQRLLPLLHRHQTQENNQPHAFSRTNAGEAERADKKG